MAQKDNKIAILEKEKLLLAMEDKQLKHWLRHVLLNYTQRVKKEKDAAQNIQKLEEALKIETEIGA